MQKQESNRLVAEFMGFETYEGNGHKMVRYSDDNERTLQDTHYHTSWDWLMEVVQKIEKIEGVYDLEEFLLIRDELVTGRITPSYDMVVQFIKWHNQQQS